MPKRAPLFRLHRLYDIVYSLSSMSEIFSERLRNARQMRELSQSDLAEKTGLQPSAISHFETGRRAPSFDNLKVLSDALQVTTDYLLGRVDQPHLTGTVATQLFRHAEKMSTTDLDTLTSFAEMLARKSKDKKES
jgi:transcriptional regulator with XRE-family HTH domain